MRRSVNEVALENGRIDDYKLKDGKMNTMTALLPMSLLPIAVRNRAAAEASESTPLRHPA
jgi:hypothetical protein